MASSYEPSGRKSQPAANHSPDQPCRSCMDFKSWAKLQRAALHSKGDDATSLPELEAVESRRKDCPLDKNELGRATWDLLHTIGATYPENPSTDDKRDVALFFGTLSKLYPCTSCAKDLQDTLKQEPIDASSQNALSQWLCRLHNKINAKLDKPIFDCSKVNERWRDGWRGGSCD